MALWHTPQLMGIKIGDAQMQFIPRDKPPRYFPGAGGYWEIDLVLVPHGQPAPAFHWLSEAVTRIKATVPTGSFSHELKGPSGGQSDLRGAAGGAALGMLAGGVVGALAGAAVGGGGPGSPVAITFHALPEAGRDLKLLVAGSANFMRDLEANAAKAAAAADW